MTKDELTNMLQGVIEHGTGGEFGALYLAIGFVTGMLDTSGKADLVKYCTEAPLHEGRIRILYDRLGEVLEEAEHANR